MDEVSPESSLFLRHIGIVVMVSASITSPNVPSGVTRELRILARIFFVWRRFDGGRCDWSMRSLDVVTAAMFCMKLRLSPTACILLMNMLGSEMSII